ncbi:MAG: type II CAAX endopeptidase family protein [Thermodesulfobacteriota bacterium]
MTKTSESSSALPLAGSVALAFVLWYVSFLPDFGNFWIKISASAMLLGVFALRNGAGPSAWGGFRGRDFLWGLILAAALYGIFSLGFLITTKLFSFAPAQVQGIYARGNGTPVWIVCLTIVLVTGPCEEIFWRGFVQGELSRRLGRAGGYVAATLAYTAIHISTGNFMLVGAAGVAGAFWGLWYAVTGRMVPLIVSHAVWSVVIFAVLPIGARI